ncbi:centrosome and spindle pole-associated protein 1 isoform X3 [Pleuronectes platessa]|uniref:centrosome and spindle pole-associated protein 1 isoform X3 n=1 Tax=Pleuronectes platessa TaxID=8262 RepID=UPI00232A3837|nr:centrosome and spindle pole-associated protein 1 isoform X3 [Pleuronectes platessa]
MDDELEDFIRERKARVAEDKASLQQDPSYMEIKAKPNRAYELTVKENIPPKNVAQRKDECLLSEENFCLPLGVEYERKKQRLQHELRLDFRHYMAQKKIFDPAAPGPLIHLNNRGSVKQKLEDWTGVLPKQRASSRRDAATLTEDSRGLQRALHLAEVKTFCPEEEEACRHHDRLGRPVELESEEDEYLKKELELLKGRRNRYTGIEASHEKRQTNRTDGREKRENPFSFAREGRRSRTQAKYVDAEFATGLIIGAADTDEALRRRKEHYRHELQEQIAEQHRNKKREKDSELKVAVTGMNDPEKQPDRIRQFGLSRRRYLQVSAPSATGESESSSTGFHNNEQIGVRERETSPPEQPHVAFQSPLLEYSSSLGLGGGGLSPSSQSAAPSFPRAMDTPRIPLFPPHPPSSVREACRSLYAEPHYCYCNRNLLDPNMAYYGHLPVPGAGHPISYWNMPPGAAVPSQLGNHSPHSQHSGSSFPEPPLQPSSEAATVESCSSVFPSESSRSNRKRILSYRDALKEQETPWSGSNEFDNKIQEQQERRRLEREEQERHEAQLEAYSKNHQPWGRGGGGAPLRDSTGNLIADLHQMHRLNEEVYTNPEQSQRKAAATVLARQTEQPEPIERISGFTHVHTPQFARGKVFANQPTQHHLHEQDTYKACLKQQIEEKMRKKAEEREQIRQEEEKEEKRLAEQRARIQREYEAEEEKKQRKEMEQKAKNEELIRLAEQRKKEAERKKKEVEEKENAALRRQNEMERQTRVEEVCREPSPPIPTLQRKHGSQRYTPRPPTVDSQRSTAPLSYQECSLSGLQSPPVPARRNQLRATGDQRDVFSELSALRRHLRSEQKRLEQDELEELDSPLSDRHQEPPLVDVFNMARLRLQGPARRPNSRNIEPRNLLRIHDSLPLNHTDRKSRLGSCDVPLEEVGVSSRRRYDHRDPCQQLSSQRTTVLDDYFDLSPPHQNDYLRSVMGRSPRGSLLESDRVFIEPLGDALILPPYPDIQRTSQLSARERRRQAKQSQHPQDRAASSQYIGQYDDYSTHAGARLQQEVEHSEGRSPNSAGHRTALSRRGNKAGPVDLSDEDSSPTQSSSRNLNHQCSVETVVTDPWMRPGTSDTLKCLDRPSRRERLAT